MLRIGVAELERKTVVEMARAGLTAERVTTAAAQLADEIGFEAVTVSAVARSFGVRDASLYSHIANLQDVRIRVALLALSELADQVSAALAGRAGKDALVAFANAYRDYAKAHPGRYAAMQIDLKPEVAAASAGPRHAEMTRAILRGYRLQEPDQTDAIRMLGATFHGFVSLERSGGFRHTARSADISWMRTLDALHALLSAWPTDPDGAHSAGATSAGATPSDSAPQTEPQKASNNA